MLADTVDAGTYSACSLSVPDAARPRPQATAGPSLGRCSGHCPRPRRTLSLVGRPKQSGTHAPPARLSSSPGPSREEPSEFSDPPLPTCGVFALPLSWRSTFRPLACITCWAQCPSPSPRGPAPGPRGGQCGRPSAVPGALPPRPSVSGLLDPSQPWSRPAGSETTPGTQSWA